MIFIEGKALASFTEEYPSIPRCLDSLPKSKKRTEAFDRTTYIIVMFKNGTSPSGGTEYPYSITVAHNRQQGTMSQPHQRQEKSFGGTTLIFQRGPPTTLQQGATFTIIVRVVLDHSWSHLGTQMQACAVNISLVDEHGACSRVGLSGSLTSSLQLYPGRRAHGVAVFDKLRARQIGLYRLRALLGVSSSTGMSIEAREDSRTFQVSKSKSNILLICR